MTWVFMIDKEEKRGSCRCLVWGKKNSQKLVVFPRSFQAFTKVSPSLLPKCNHPNNHNTAPTYPNDQILSYQSPPPNLQNFPPCTQITLNLTKFQLPIRILLPTVPMYSRATDRPSPFIKSKLQFIENPSRTTKLQCQIIKQTLIKETKLLVRIPEIISRCLPLSKEVMILPV